MSKKKVTVTFEKNRRPKVNGKRTKHYSDGNNGRNVYISDGYVLKVDDRGYTHDDMTMWKRIKPRDRKYFVPTLAQGITKDGHGWSIQPYVELDWDVTDEARQIVEKLYDKYNLHDIDIYHDEPRNWGMHNGQPVIFDYGLGVDSSS